MNGLIQITRSNINGAEVNSVNARDLYFFLKVKSDFATWIKRQLDGFIEDYDYIRLHKKVEANNATQIDYILSFDVSKHIAMLQRSEEGMKIRKYFIDIEKQSILPSVPQTFSEALLLASKQAEIIEQQQLSLEQKSQTIANVVHSGNTYTASQVAKDMPNPISAHLLNKMLNEAGIIFWQNGSWQLYAKYANHNLTQIKETKPDADGRTFPSLRWTALGKSWIYKNWTEIKQRVAVETLSEWELRITSNLPKVPMPNKQDRNF